MARYHVLFSKEEDGATNVTLLPKNIRDTNQIVFLLYKDGSLGIKVATDFGQTLSADLGDIETLEQVIAQLRRAKPEK